MFLKEQEANIKFKQFELLQSKRFNYTPEINKKSRDLADRIKRTPLYNIKSFTPNYQNFKTVEPSCINPQSDSHVSIKPFMTKGGVHSEGVATSF